MTGTDASTPGSPQTPPEDVRSRLEILRGHLERLEGILADRRQHPLWHWFTQLDGPGTGTGADTGRDDADTRQDGGHAGQDGGDPGSIRSADTPGGGGSAPPWVRIPPIVERAPLALEDWTVSFGHRLWMDRTPDLPADPAAYRRPGAAATDPDTHTAIATGTRPHVALGLPGIWETWRHFHVWAQALHDAGWDVHLLESLEDMTAPIPDLARRVEEYLRDQDLHDVILFAHSKGGLVGKAVMLGPERRRVRGLIACATPFNGAPITWLVPTTELSELAPDSPTIVELAADRAVNRRIIQVEAEWDQSVPPSPLTGVRHVTLPITGHSTMLFSAQVARTLTVLARQLLDADGSTPGTGDDRATPPPPPG